jgi:hypothetical protein
MIWVVLSHAAGAERWHSPAAGSGSDAGADAGSSQVQCVVRRECAHGHRVCLQLWSGSHMTHGLHPHLRGETIPPVVTGLPPGTVWSHRNFFVPSWHDTLHRCLYRFDPSNSRSPSTHRKQAVLSTGVFAISRRGRNRLRLWPSHVATRASFHSASSPTHLTLIFVRELLLRSAVVSGATRWTAAQ